MEGTAPKGKLSRARTLAELAERIEAVERGQHEQAVAAVATGLPAPFDALPRGVLHEWLCCDDGRTRAWTPPLLIFMHLAQRALGDEQALAIWIGRNVWPQALALARTSQRLLDCSLLVDPVAEDDGETRRLWTIDLCLRSSAASVVVADVSGMQLAHSRRLQLAAESGRALTLLARPDAERATLSAASMRWRIDRTRSPTARPRWRIERVRCKGVQRGSGIEADASFVLEHDRATGCLCVPADLADRSDQAALASHSTHAARRTG